MQHIPKLILWSCIICASLRGFISRGRTAKDDLQVGTQDIGENGHASIFGTLEFAHVSVPNQLSITKTIGRMVVDHADGLHVGIYDDRADEAEASLLQVFAEGLRDG